MLLHLHIKKSLYEMMSKNLLRPELRSYIQSLVPLFFFGSLLFLFFFLEKNLFCVFSLPALCIKSMPQPNLGPKDPLILNPWQM